MPCLDLQKVNVLFASARAGASGVAWVRILFAAFVLGLMLPSLGCSSGEEKESSAVVSVQAAAVQTQTIEDEVSTDAILYPRDQAAIVQARNDPRDLTGLDGPFDDLSLRINRSILELRHQVSSRRPSAAPPHGG